MNIQRIYTNPRSSIIIETTVIKIIRSQYHVVIIIIRHRSRWHREIEDLSALLVLCKRNPSVESTHGGARGGLVVGVRWG